MTPQERELLTPFLQQMTQTQAGQKDAEADALIRDAFARQPDAAYLLVQRAMGLEYALQATQAQAAKLQAELDQLHAGMAATRSGFLDTATTWGRSAPAPTPAQIAPARVAAAQAPVQAAAQPGPAAAASSWGSGMLGTVATTAAGVVAGSFLFQGIQGLMGHHGASFGDHAATNAGGHAGANATPLAPESGDALLGDAEAGASDDAADYAALDSGDADSGDSA